MSNRPLYIRLVFIFGALLLGYKALDLQVLDSSFRSKADASTIDKLVVYPSRGLIYDRAGRLLVYNDPMYDLLVTYNQVDPQMDTAEFCRLLRIDREYFEQALNPDWSSSRFSKSVPFVFLSKISAKTYATFQESLYKFPGFFVQLRNARGYPHNNAAQVLGYIREVNRSEVKGMKDAYAPGDYIGASGLEAAYESKLRGQKGAQYVLKDNLGRIVQNYEREDLNHSAVRGKDITTTLDLELQKYGEQLMQNKKGSIVALDPGTGEILTMVSSPTYDPQELTISNNERGNAYDQLVSDTLKPFLNRAVTAQYPPGSLFKPLVALIALQEDVWPLNRTVSCPGGYALNGRILTGCHGHPTCRNITSAIQHSCNAYFVSVFRKIVDQEGFYNPQKGLKTFNDYLDRFGLGKRLGIDFPSEQPGNFPEVSYFEKIYENERWNSIWLRSLGIGQGELLMTNVQMANIAAMIANRGYYVTPHLLRGYRDPGPGDTIPRKFRERQFAGIDSIHFPPVIRGMELAVTSGTARMAYIQDIPVCGKTGTAENPHGQDHSIFLCFAPKDDPEIAVAVYVENAGFGGTYAAPIASLIVEKKMRGEISRRRQWIEQRMLNANLIRQNLP